ncbi:zinc finger protein VAR3, chloroplastic, partial [Melia azedarach]
WAAPPDSSSFSLLLLSSTTAALHSFPSPAASHLLFLLSTTTIVTAVATHLSHTPPQQRLLPIKSSRQLHTQPTVAFPNSPSQRFSHPWPEFRSLLGNLSSFVNFTRLNADDEYAEGANLPDDFLRAASACLAFARDWPNLLGMVSRRDVEVVVESGMPFLFKSGNDSLRRMKSFLGNDVLGSDGANTVDLMRFLLTYASDVTALETNNLYNRDLVESSVRNLFSELAKLSCSSPGSNFSGSVHNQFLDGYGCKPRPFGQNIEMKRGDWICQRCSFMNFARNVKCLECSEARPKRLLTGGEWECPQCDFFNYARNTVCLRCDCKRSGEVSLATASSRSGPGYGYGGSANNNDIESRLAANEEKAQRWFSKVSQMDSTSDMSSAIADEDFPEIMPLRKGVNRFVVSTRKTPLERRLANAQYRRNLGSDGTPEGDDFQMEGVNKTLGVKVSQKLDDILGRSSASSDQNARADSSPPISSLGSSRYGNPRESNSSYVPFVPLPADMFAKKPENPKVDEKTHAVSENYQSVASNSDDETGAVSGDSEYHYSRDNLQLSEKPVNQEEIKHKENEEADKSERWFKRVAEIDGVTDLASAISDEDFPEIMPMRKGENRFVVNRKKDRSLTSPTYKRRMAMEQANNNNFVPFVPFPPDYFARKDKQPGGRRFDCHSCWRNFKCSHPREVRGC